MDRRCSFFTAQHIYTVEQTSRASSWVNTAHPTPPVAFSSAEKKEENGFRKRLGEEEKRQRLLISCARPHRGFACTHALPASSVWATLSLVYRCAALHVVLTIIVPICSVVIFFTSFIFALFCPLPARTTFRARSCRRTRYERRGKAAAFHGLLHTSAHFFSLRAVHALLWSCSFINCLRALFVYARYYRLPASSSRAAPGVAAHAIYVWGGFLRDFFYSTLMSCFAHARLCIAFQWT